jgi:two-component system phosphate regulon sensor histidine kinase PhoR
VESFFVFNEGEKGASAFDLYNRSNRGPAWGSDLVHAAAYPVALDRDPQGANELIEAMRTRITEDTRFLVFEVELNRTPYQIVAKLLPAGHTAGPRRIVGFTVNLPWVRDRYFGELAREVSRIGDVAGLISLAIEDDSGNTVATTGSPLQEGYLRERSFSPIFFDPAMLSTLAPGSPRAPVWTAKIGAGRAPAPGVPWRGVYAILAGAAVASLGGVLLTVRAVRARAALAAMQSDFVCGVTHELKTPLSLIRLISETLGQRRYSSIDTVTDYAQLLSQEAWRLTRHIDNILTFAQATHSRRQQQVESIEVAELVEDVLERFRPQLSDKAFEVTVDVPDELPKIRGDRTMLLQALDNLLDNAIKYSTHRREVIVTASSRNGTMHVEVADRGVGIATDELPRVFEKFYRGRSVKAGGSGLGLAIVKRIIEENRGTVEIASVPGEGTQVRLTLPIDR